MSSEHHPIEPLTRRQFLAVLLSGGASAALAQAVPLGMEFQRLTQEDTMVRRCNEYLSSHPSLRQYTIAQRPPLDGRTEPYQLIIQNPSESAHTVRLAFSEGEAPSLCVINHQGVCNYGELKASLHVPQVENIHDAPFVDAQSLQALKDTVAIASGDATHNILILGDSWTRWNGFEASYPAILQTLSDLSGQSAHIIDASATSLGVTDYRYQYARLTSQHNPSQVLYTYHPNSDARYDAPRAHLGSDAQRASIGDVGGLRNPEPFKHAATNLLRTWETKNVNAFTTLKALAKQVMGKSPSDALINPEELHEYIRQANIFTSVTARDGVPSHLLGLPVSDLGAFDISSYTAIWQTLSHNHYARGGTSCVNAHGSYPSNCFDEYTHPTLLGSFKLATLAYAQLFHTEPTPAVLEHAFLLHTQRRAVMNNIRNAMRTLP